MKNLLLTTLLLTAPAASAQTPIILKLSAPVGSGAELVSSTSSRITMSDMQVTAVPGTNPSQDSLDKARDSVAQGMAQVNAQPATQLTGKVFYKVTSRDASGATTLVSSVIQSVPGQPAITIRYTQTIGADGQVSGLSIESDNPQISALFKSLTPEKLQQMADQNGNNFAGIYGVPLMLDEPRTTTLNMDAQDLMGSIFSALAGSKSQTLFKDVQSSPLVVNTTTTYRGLNAQGQHVFESSSSYDNWVVSVKSQAEDMPNISMELADVNATGTQTYRKDGLLSSSNQNTSMKMNLTLTLDGVQVKVTLNLDQSVSIKPR